MPHFLSTFRLREESNYFVNQLGDYMIELVDQSAAIVQKTHNDVKCGYSSSNSLFSSMDSIVASFKCFVSSPLFSKWRDENGIDVVICTGIVQSIERLLKGLAKLFEACSDYRKDIYSGSDLPDCKTLQTDPADNSNNIIVDMELDVNNGSKDMDILTLDGKITHGFAFSSANLKMDIVSFISSFFSVCPSVTWDILFDLVGKESNPRVGSGLSYIMLF